MMWVAASSDWTNVFISEALNSDTDRSIGHRQEILPVAQICLNAHEMLVKIKDAC
jgi:hypothetical protein